MTTIERWWRSYVRLRPLVQDRKSNKAIRSLVNLFPSSVIFCFALVLRIWGLTWSLPENRHVLTYHPDEGVNLLAGVLDRGYVRPHLDLRYYNYGGLYFYLWQGAGAVNGAYGIVRVRDPEMTATLIDPNAQSSQSVSAMLLVGRLLSAFLGAGTAVAVVALGRLLFNNKTAILAGFLFAMAPAAVVHSHYATVDVPATFTVTVALVYAAKLQQTLTRATVVSAGLWAGLAAATKYNCALVVLAPISALWMSGTRGVVGRSRYHVLSLLGLQGCAVAGFLIGCPGVLINPVGFWHDLSYEFVKSRQGMGLLFVLTGNGWWYHLTSSLRFGLGIPLLVLCLIGLSIAVYRRRRQQLLLLAFVGPYYLLIGWAQVRFLRYIIPIIPALCIFGGWVLAKEWSSAWARQTTRICGAIVIGATLIISVAMDRLFTMEPPQDQSESWIRSTVPAGSSIGLVTSPWYYTPPLSPMFTLFGDARIRSQFAREIGTYNLRPPNDMEWDPAVMLPDAPAFFVVSDVESQDALRLNWKPALPFFQLFAQQYSARVFENTPSILGIDLGKPSYVPNDWLYTYPRITVYRRKAVTAHH